MSKQRRSYRTSRPSNMDDEQLLVWMLRQGIRTESGCLEWQGSAFPRGYGAIGHQGKVHRVHRLAYQLATGEPCKGMAVRHKCDNPRCFALGHLEPGTHQDNTDDKTQRLRQAGKLNGHQVTVIRNLAMYGIPYRHIANRFGVTPLTVSRAARGLAWTHAGGAHCDALPVRGERSPQAKLSNTSVEEIMRYLASGASCAEAGRLVGISRETVSKIANGKRWSVEQERIGLVAANIVSRRGVDLTGLT